MTTAPHGTGVGIRSFPDAAKGKFLPGPIVRHFISELKWRAAPYSFANIPLRLCGCPARMRASWLKLNLKLCFRQLYQHYGCRACNRAICESYCLKRLATCPSLHRRKYSVWFLRFYLSPFLYYLRSHTDLERGAAIPKLKKRPFSHFQCCPYCWN